MTTGAPTPTPSPTPTPGPGSGPAKAADHAGAGGASFRFLYFTDLVKRPLCAGKIKDRIGKLSDIVVALKEPYPEAVGIFVDHGWGRPTQFIPWNKVIRVEDDAIFVQARENGERYPPFVDQPGWLLIERHLIGRTVLDIDDRRIEAVNDVHLLEASGRLALVHVDTSFNGFLRRWGLGRLRLVQDRLISWKYVQPLSVEDVGAQDTVSLSVTRRRLSELPSEDLADALEELSGREQEALFSALDSDKAAETLLEAEPRAQRQLIAAMRKERASIVLSEMSTGQVAALFSVLPHDQVTALLRALPRAQATRIRHILSEREMTAGALAATDFVAVTKDVTVGAVLDQIRHAGLQRNTVSYVYVVTGEEKTLVGVADLRDLVLAPDERPICDVMVAPVITTAEDDVREDLETLFAKYHFRMIPVVDAQDRLRGVIRYKDIMKGLVTKAKV